MTVYSPIKSVSFASEENEILKLWENIHAFERSINQRSAAKAFVFYDGPPFATGLPHYGHLVASTIKDVVARYWTMRGFKVERRFGWDTHGLPIEMLIEKEKGLSGPQSIKEYGISKFNEDCRSGVLKYTNEWRKTIHRLGRWVDFDNDYKTMDPDFMESVWWVFGELWKKKLVYKGERVMPYSCRLSTSLSNFEANLDYRDVQDPALTIRCRLKGKKNTFLLIWTTTPWTLPSNLAVAVGEDIDYVYAQQEGEKEIYVVAKARATAVLGEGHQIIKSCKGRELAGVTYEPLFPYFQHLSKATAEYEAAFVVLTSDHVSTENGTGLVHMAPAFGQEDYDACSKNKLPLVDPLNEEGCFTEVVSDFSGQNIKEADSHIIKHLKDDGKVFHHDTIQHSYPYCWRSGTPLIYRAMAVWFVKASQLKEDMVKHNKTIHWVPGAVGQKRFGNWLKDAQDWAISRSRFWGTPIPVWNCDKCDETTCIKSIKELEELSGKEVKDLHMHFIDNLDVNCQKCSGVMKRIPEVFDCWFESGSMPYAQNHYPFEKKEAFDENFPADFIAEGLDQTRGWFYTLLVLSTALFNKPPFKNVVVNGMVLAEDGSKMSKSKQNFPMPDKVINEYGSDALRAYLINSPVVRAEPLAFSEEGVREIVRMVLLPLQNAWSFFAQYANIDGWDPKTGLKNAPLVSDRREVDRWILSKLQTLIKAVNEQMDGYYLYKVIPEMLGFIDDLTNWYIRRSRRRFWKNAADSLSIADKDAAYATLYEVLVTFSKVLSPALPFITERIYQHLVVETSMHQPAEPSIHLCDYPMAELKNTDAKLEAEIDLIRKLVKMGRALRERSKLKIKQPLASMTVVTHEPQEILAVNAHKDILLDELNLKEVLVVEDDDALCTLQFKPNFKTLGRIMGKSMKEASTLISQFTKADYAHLHSGLAIEVCGKPVTLEDVMVVRQAKDGIAVDSDAHLTVALNTEVSKSLLQEGLMREVLSLLQKLRKDKGLEITDRINVSLWSSDENLKQALLSFQEYIASEVLADSLSIEEIETQEKFQINGLPLFVMLQQK